MRFIGSKRQNKCQKPSRGAGLRRRAPIHAGRDTDVSFGFALSRWIFGTWILTLSGLGVSATETTADPGSSTSPAAQLVNSPLQHKVDYSERTDVELTELGARWDDLSAPEREALLREVKLRMAQRKDSDGVLMIRTQRRYGRIYRSDDGRYLKIETKIVRVRPADPTQTSRSSGFGVGFEKRTGDVTVVGVTDPDSTAVDPTAVDPAGVGRLPGASSAVDVPAMPHPPVTRVADPSR